MFVKKLIVLLLLSSNIFVFGQASITMQNTYPTNYFGSPLDIPLILSGTFGELRPNHFHAGLDIKTQQREGLKVLRCRFILLLQNCLSKKAKL